MSIVTESPLWLIIFCLLAGILYAGGLYFKNSRLNEMPAAALRFISASRFIVITFISFLLLSPLVKTINRELEKPVIVIAQDNSESVVSCKDSALYRGEYLKNMQNLMGALSEKYEVAFYSFADNISKQATTDSIKFKDKQTDISAFIDEIDTRYSNRNLGTVIIASDGLYNKGANPVYSAEKLKVPIYTIALGDTTVKKDASILKVEHNRIAYLGNKFPLQIIISAKQLKGKSTNLSVSKGNKTLFSQTIDFTSSSYTATIPVLLEAKETGLQEYKVTITAVNGESNLTNNTRKAYIDVLDTRQKVLILANNPHPDVAALKQAISTNQNYEVESYLLDDFNQPLKKYNLVILYQINKSGNGTRVVNELSNSKIPVWLFTGASTLVKNDFTPLSSASKTNEAEATMEPNFALFTISDELKKASKSFPALVCPYGTYPNDNNSALFYQRIGVVETKTPILTFNNDGDYKYALFYGEGIWKWRLQNFAASGNHDLFNELVSKTIQYLSVRADKSFFRLTHPSAFAENESISIGAELYNDSYELINEPEVNAIITDANNVNYTFTFTKTDNAYRLNAGMLPVGAYTIEAKTTVGKKQYVQKSKFSVLALQAEHTNTTADHQLLYNIAQQHQGQMVYPNELNKLLPLLNNRDDIKTISYSENQLSDLINKKWLFALITLLLTIEWVVRKRNGSY